MRAPPPPSGQLGSGVGLGLGLGLGVGLGVGSGSPEIVTELVIVRWAEVDPRCAAMILALKRIEAHYLLEGFSQ